MAPHKRLAVVAAQPCYQAQALALANSLNLPLALATDRSFALLLVVAEQLSLQPTAPHSSGPIGVDFAAGRLEHRRHYGGGRGQLLARAVGLNKYSSPTVIDVTAGLGQDSFILATLGCHVTMIERSRVVAALLEDGLRRAQQHAWFRQLELNLVVDDARAYLAKLQPSQYPNVIYCDPMFPERHKSALVKKEMRILRDVVGDDMDFLQLFTPARRVVTKRLVVKRARYAPPMTSFQPDFVLTGKSTRYDVYLPQ